MAELTVGGPEATDMFSLGETNGYYAQSSNNDDQTSLAQAQGAKGDVIASQLHGEMNAVSCVYKYTGSDDMYDATDAAKRTLPLPGELKNSFIVDSSQVAYSNTDWPTLTVTGHNHDTQAHDTGLATYSPSIAVPGGFGCPGLLANTDSTSAPISEQFTLSADHVDADNEVGDHLAGASFGGKEEYAGEYVGTPTLTDTGWYQTSSAAADASTEFDSTSVAYEKPISRDT